MTDLFTYCDSIPSYDTSQVYMARLGKDIGSTDYLINALFYTLSFPGYFGFNWNALYDCMCDFSWIREKHIVIFHEELPRIEQRDLKIYLEVLRDACKSWQGDSEHVVEVIFMKEDKLAIEKILTNSL